ncbi:immunoglobulin E-set [Phakopsora pachyrhizi]|uniref:Immunoglobulin E-set n=1 Tax=Phakopsora pachyrhizi TaxID=170000 RepID=A0AAV0BK47_PHAPC|nr:immunoglobulin E-set [Phakopsora pachyrhizi]
MAGYNPNKAKASGKYAKLDAEDKSLRKWKELLGIVAGAAAAGNPNLVPYYSNCDGPYTSRKPPKFKKEPITIKEGIEYSVKISFKVENGVVSGMKYVQVVKNASMRMDMLKLMMGLYEPCNNLHVKRFVSKESQSGMLARSEENSSRFVAINDQLRPPSFDDSSNQNSQISQPLRTTEASQLRLDKESQDGQKAGNGVDEDDVESNPEDSES